MTPELNWIPAFAGMTVAEAILAILKRPKEETL